MFDRPSKHGDYGVFVRLEEEQLVEAFEGDSDGVSFVVIHDDTEEGLSPSERVSVAFDAALRPIYWNDFKCRYWMYDFKHGEHWCRMVQTDLPYYVAIHMLVED